MKTLFQFVAALWIFTMVLLATANAQTETDFDKRETKLAEKKEMIKQSLALTEEEAPAFWSLYDEMEKEMVALHENQKEMKRQFKEQPEDLTETEIAEFIKARMEADDKMHQLRMKYINQFMEILPPSKVLELLKLQKEFRGEMKPEDSPVRD